MFRELLSHLLEYLPWGVVVYDKDGYLKYANSIALQMFGTTMEKVTDMDILEDSDSIDKARWRKGLEVAESTVAWLEH